MMTREEFLSALKARGATLAPGATANQIGTTNIAMQRIRAAMLPMFMIDLYGAIGGIKLGSGYIFGPTDVNYQSTTYPVPSLIQVNEEISGIQSMRGKTIFGRNDLFWFGFDSFGTCFMFDNLTLRPLRKYDDPYRAMLDCLIAGKI